MSENTHGTFLFGKAIPLYIQILAALLLAIAFGIFMGAGQPDETHRAFIEGLMIPATLILKALRTLAVPLIFFAVLNSFLTTEISAKMGWRLTFLLLSNTLAAIIIGLLVANFLRPGSWGELVPPSSRDGNLKVFNVNDLVQNFIPEAVLAPFVNNDVIQLIILAIVFGAALREFKSAQIKAHGVDYIPVQQIINTLFQVIIRILTWVIAWIPIAVFGIVSRTVALKGFEPFKALGVFIIAVLTGLFIQFCFYMIRVRFSSRVGPLSLLKNTSDALITAFSTASSTVTMPITFKALVEKVRLRESSASIGALVGSNFNNDGTALYEAMAALFIAQVINLDLSLSQQLIVVLTSVFASVGAAGIPEAGLVTMTLVFSSIGLPTEYIALLLTVDWFLDRCRTVMNVMGDITVSCLLDGKVNS